MYWKQSEESSHEESVVKGEGDSGPGEGGEMLCTHDLLEAESRKRGRAGVSNYSGGLLASLTSVANSKTMHTWIVSVSLSATLIHR